MPKQKRTMLTGSGVTAATPISTLGTGPLIDSLDPADFVVLIKLIAATAIQRRKTVRIRNAQLHRVPRSAARALRSLQEHGLIKVTYPGGVLVAREIEVL